MYQILFFYLRYSLIYNIFHMIINKGIKFQEDPQYKKIQDQRIQLKADRHRTETEKTMDDLLFGSGAVRRKPKTDSTPAQQQAVKPIPSPVEQKKAVARQETVKIEQVIPIKQETRAQDPGRQGFNRPSYIRKLKKIAQNYEFAEINQKNHYYYDITKPFQCDRARVQVLQKLNSGDSFTDKQFPANSFSVGKKFWKQNVEWKRAKELCNRPTFGKYVEPNDIQIGRLSCPSFVSTLSCLAERERNIKRLIQDQQYNQNGFYYIRLNVNSVWRYIAVDDFLPTLDGDNLGLLSFRDSESDISLSLVEKAYAKAYGGYDVFEKKCHPEHYLRDLTGSRVARFSLSQSSLLENIKFSLQQNWTVVAVPNNRIQELGLNSKFNISIIGMNARGFEIRNSWGTIVDRPKINFSKEGIFQLSHQQASKYFDYILVAETDDTYATSTVQSKHHAGFYSSYNFKIKSPAEAIISASQWDHRMFPHETNYNYSPFRLIIDKVNIGAAPQYIAAGYSHSERNIDILVSLVPGQYSVTCIGSWGGSAYDYSITVYGNHAVKFEKKYTESFPNIISKSLQEVNLKNGKRSAKGHVDEYILYHEPSNLMLLTNLNLGDKPYDYTQDLSKINFGTLNLLNAPNHDENFEGKVEQQVSSIKEDHNNQRRWSVHLGPRQAYTWVISTRQNYNANNFKSWGFK